MNRDTDLFRKAVLEDYHRVYDYISRHGSAGEVAVERLVGEVFEIVARRVWRLLKNDQLRFSDIWLAASAKVLQDYDAGLEAGRRCGVVDIAGPDERFPIDDDPATARAAAAAALDDEEREYLYLATQGFTPSRVAAAKGLDPEVVRACSEMAARRFAQEFRRREFGAMGDG